MRPDLICESRVDVTPRYDSNYGSNLISRKNVYYGRRGHGVRSVELCRKRWCRRPRLSEDSRGSGAVREELLARMNTDATRSSTVFAQLNTVEHRKNREECANLVRSAIEGASAR